MGRRKSNERGLHNQPRARVLRPLLARQFHLDSTQSQIQVLQEQVAMTMDKVFELFGIATVSWGIIGLVVIVGGTTLEYNPVWGLIAIIPTVFCLFCMLGIFSYKIFTEK